MDGRGRHLYACSSIGNRYTCTHFSMCFRTASSLPRANSKSSATSSMEARKAALSLPSPSLLSLICGEFIGQMPSLVNAPDITANVTCIQLLIVNICSIFPYDIFSHFLTEFYNVLLNKFKIDEILLYKYDAIRSKKTITLPSRLRNRKR